MTPSNYVLLFSEKAAPYHKTLNQKYICSPFEWVNFCLFSQILTTHNWEEDMFHIYLPDKFYRKELYQSLVIGLSTIKYWQNTHVSSCNISTYEQGQLYYDTEKHRCLKYKRKEYGDFAFSDVNESKQGRYSDTSILYGEAKLKKLIPLSREAKYNRNTADKLQKCYNFFKEILAEGYRPLAQFHKKTLIIAEKELIDETLSNDLYLPFRYNGKDNQFLGLEALIEIANDYADAEMILKQDLNKCIEEVIVLGYSKYQDEGVLSSLNNLKNMGRFKKLILLGSRKPKIQYDSVVWRWANDEVYFLKSQKTKELLNIPIKNETLQELQQNLTETCKPFMDNKVLHDVLLGSLYFLVSPYFYFFRERNSDEIIAIQNKIWLSIKNDFEEAGYTEEIEQINKPLQDIIPNIAKKFYNSKNNYCNQNLGKNVYIVLHHKEKEHIKSLSDNYIDFNELEKLIKDAEFSAKKTERTTFIVPFLPYKAANPLWYYHLCERATELGSVQILYYNKVEKERIEKFSRLYELENVRALKHLDRRKFLGEKNANTILNYFYKDKELNQEDEDCLDNLDSLEGEDILIIQNSKSFFEKYFGESVRLGNKMVSKKDDSVKDDDETIQYKVVFENGEYAIYNANEPIAKQVDNDNFKLTRIENLSIGDKIVSGFDVNFYNSLEALKSVSELKSEIDKIRKASKLWREWLSKLLFYYKEYKCKGDEKKAKRELFGRLSLAISQLTFENWFKEKKEYFFPINISDLEKIVDLRLKIMTPEQKEKDGFEAEVIKTARDDRSGAFKAVIFRLNKELIQYLLSQQKGEILSRIEENHIKNMLHKKKTVTVKLISIYYES